MSESVPTWNMCRIPPCIVRLLAKRGEYLATDPELMRRTGWTRSKLTKTYRAATWDRVTVGDMDRFLWACGLSPNKQRRYLWLLKRTWQSKDGIKNMKHLRTGGQSWRGSVVDALVKMVEKVLEQHERGSGDTQ